MSAVARLRGSIGRALSIGGAFFRLGVLQSMAYPLGLFTEQAGALVPAVTFLFIQPLIRDDAPGVAADYYTYVIVGLLVIQITTAGLMGFSREVDVAVLRGHFETFLVEPVPWKLLPFGMVLWPAALGVSTALLIALVASLLGARFHLPGLPIAIVTTVLSLGAGLVLGLLSAALKVLAKRGDPVLFIITLGAQVLSGIFYPISNLPTSLQAVSWILPHTYSAVAMRRALMPLGSEIAGPTLGQALGGLLVFDIVGLAVALWVFNRAMETGREYGLLASY